MSGRSRPQRSQPTGFAKPFACLPEPRIEWLGGGETELLASFFSGTRPTWRGRFPHLVDGQEAGASAESAAAFDGEAHAAAHPTPQRPNEHAPVEGRGDPLAEFAIIGELAIVTGLVDPPPGLVLGESCLLRGVG